MGAPSKRARKIRTAGEFDLARMLGFLSTPKTGPSAFAWTLEQIAEARRLQQLGSFNRPARLAEAMRTDDALFVAKENRLDPLQCTKVQIIPSPRTGGAKVAAEAEALYGQHGIGVTPDTVRDIQECVVDHGVAFAQNCPRMRPDGSRIDFFVQSWPIEFVRWDPYRRCFMTQVEGDADVPIVHGDGRWIVFQEGEVTPFKNGAILAAAMVWARHAFGVRDWAKDSQAHGNARMIAELPEALALQDANGQTSEAKAMLKLLQDLISGESPLGIIPSGSKVQFLANASTAWNIFTDLVSNAEKAAARIYLGTDGILGTTGGAPGIDITALFGVASTKVQGDDAVISRGLHTGSIEPWTALNFGDSSLAPTRRYLLPDPDADAARAAYATREQAFYAAVDRARSNGFVVNQPFVDGLAKRHGVDAPQLAEKASSSEDNGTASGVRGVAA